MVGWPVIRSHHPTTQFDRLASPSRKVGQMVNVKPSDITRLAQFGMVVVPTPPGEKNPKRDGWQHTQFGQYQLAAWQSEAKGAFVVTGVASGWVVIDCDNQEAIALWRERIGDLWDDLPKSQGSKGVHLWFRHDQPLRSFKQRSDQEALDLGANYDFQADGAGVMVPPSLHPSGVRYKWLRLPYEESPGLPPGLVEGALNSGGGSPRQRELRAGGGAPTPRAGISSILARLLENPPTGDTGRNDYLTACAGHIVKHIPWPDAQLALLRWIDQGLAVPYESTDPGGVEKIWQSVAQRDVVFPDRSTGFLLPDGRHLVTTVKVGEKGKEQQRVEPISDFDLRVLGKYTDEEHQTFYRLQIRSELTDSDRYVVEASSAFSQGRTLDPWLAARELNMWTVDGDQAGRTSQPKRMTHYLSTQEAPRLRMVSFMGWHDEAKGFVCNEGVITSEGLNPSGGWIPDPMVTRRDAMQHRYGFDASEQEATRVLREVLTYQDDTVCSVFGAWWAACLIKAQLMPKISGFPFVAIEAMSGSGKTEGFFGLMVRLNGASRVGGRMTPPSLRDSIASNRSGIAWLDDLDDFTWVYQDVRTATNEAFRSKKKADNVGTDSVQLVAPVLLTGESMPGLTDQRALMDRLIRLDVPPAKGRRSKHGDYEQWADIIALQEQHPDMWRLSGWYVQQALRHMPTVMAQWKALKAEGGRHADKMAVLRVGARLLALMTDSPWHVELVDEWCAAQREPEGDFLTNRILPELLRDYEVSRSARGWKPVFVDDENIVWWHLGRVQDEWAKKHRNGDARIRGFGEEETLKKHRAAMGVTLKEDRRQFDIHHDGAKRDKKWYWRCPPEISARILDKAES